MSMQVSLAAKDLVGLSAASIMAFRDLGGLAGVGDSMAAVLVRSLEDEVRDLKDVR